MQLPICVDDFGISVYLCRYTNAFVWADAAVVVGSMIAGANVRYVMAATDEAKTAHRVSSIFFHESEENCNTCMHLERVKHEKNSAGLLFGKCKKIPATTSHQYPLKNGVMMFHPDDPMHMPCYTSRWAKLSV